MSLRIDKVSAITKEAFGPFRTYHLSRGLTMEFNATDLVVKGGPVLFKTFPLPPKPSEDFWITPDASAEMVKSVEHDIGVKVVGMSAPISNYGYMQPQSQPEQLPDASVQLFPPCDALFRVDGFLISGEWLAEALLSKLLLLESLIRKAACYQGIDEGKLKLGEEFCATFIASIEDGKLGPDGLNTLIHGTETSGVPIREAFFVSNAESIAEDMRNTMLAACHHLANMTSRIWEINQSSPMVSSLVKALDEPWEVVHGSWKAATLSFEYTSAVIACYSSLDMLYQLFVYLTREPFGDPQFPSNLHFPDANSNKIFQGGGKALVDDPLPEVLPLAIPNLSAGHFGALRRTRNDLVHNMTSDAMRPRVYIGWGLPPVNCLPLQYTQYLTRDIDPDGKPITHDWIRRFYETQADAQDTLYDWLVQSWQCIFDTTEWLIHRLNRRVIEG